MRFPFSGWFKRNNTPMAELQDTCVRRLDLLREAFEKIESLTTQLHRVARERDQEREKHLAWKTTSNTWKAAAKAARTAQDKERELRLAAEELRDHYLEQLENEEE